MAKITYLKDIPKFKPTPKCPYLSIHMQPCEHQGISMKPAYSPKALAIATTAANYHKSMRVPPREYVIIETLSLLSHIPIDNNNPIIRCYINNLTDSLQKVDNKAIDLGISCYNMTLYYSELYPDIFIHTEDIHADEWS